MYCKHCGTELPEGTKYCPSCGTPQESQTRQEIRNYECSRPSNHLALAIIVTLMCCIPLGIVSIVYSGKVDTALSKGDISEAESMSRKARNWAIAGIIISAASVIMYFIIMFIFVSMGTIGSIWEAQELFSL